MVDDEKDILDLFNEYLSSNGYNVISFNNPIYALEYFYQNISNCSVVITDYKMPQMSGIDFIKKIKEKDSNSNIKTMIVSAYVKDDLLQDNPYIKRIDKIIEKPVDVDTLKNEVTNLI